MHRKITYFIALVTILLLTGCNGVSFDYLMARAHYLLTGSSNQPPDLIQAATLVPATLAPTKLSTLEDAAQVQEETPTPPTKGRDPAQTTPLPPATGKATLSGTTSVPIRSGPGMQYDRIGVLTNGQTVEVIGHSPKGAWWRIRAEGVEGWVYAEYLVVDHPLSVPCVPFGRGDCAVPAIPGGNDQAMAAIRALASKPDLSLSFREETDNPNADMRPALVYVDEQGSVYWVDKETAVIVSWLPELDGTTGTGLSIDDQRAIAMKFAEAHSPAWGQNRSRLTLTESTKDGSSYAFRWEDRTLTGHTLYPVVLVAVRTDGQILSYMNTLEVLVK